MELIFNANTPEELRQEIVKFLQIQIDFRQSLSHTTSAVLAKRQIEHSALALTTIKVFIEKARIEPQPTAPPPQFIGKFIGGDDSTREGA